MTLFARGIKNAPIPLVPTWQSRSVPVLETSSIALSDRTYASYTQIYASQVWVYVAVNKYARGIPRLPFKPYQRDGEDREQLRDGALANLLQRPMGTGISPFEWMSAIVGNVAVYGNCICVKVQASRDADVEQIWPFSPLGWTVDQNGTYKYRPPSGGDEKTFPAWKIWHPQFWAATSTGFGVAPIEPLRRTLATEDAAQRLAVASFGNGMRPSGVLTSKTAIKDEALTRLAANMKRLYAGVDNAFKPMVLEGDLSWLPMSATMVDSAVVDHRKLSREEVAAVFDLPQPTIGILDESNFASVDQFHVMLYQDSFSPYLRMIERSFFASVIDGVPAYENQFVEFDLAEVMRGDLPSRTIAYQRSLAWMTPNEIRRLENLPALDDPNADILHVPGFAVPDAAITDGSQNTPGQSTRQLGRAGGAALANGHGRAAAYAE